MTRRDDIEDFREWKLHHPPGWWRRPRIRPDNREVAVAYCEMGFEIIPLWPSSKSPALRSPHEWFSPERGTCHGECGQLGHGFYDARADAAWADEYWRAHPDHGIGIRPAPGMAVFDVDPRHGGDVALAALVAQHSRLPETTTTRSGRGDGGRHLWFDNVPGPVRQQLCRGVDILRHERNFVIGPPSLHWVNDQPYTFEKPIVGTVKLIGGLGDSGLSSAYCA